MHTAPPPTNTCMCMIMHLHRSEMLQVAFGSPNGLALKPQRGTVDCSQPPLAVSGV